MEIAHNRAASLRHRGPNICPVSPVNSHSLAHGAEIEMLGAGRISVQANRCFRYATCMTGYTLMVDDGLRLRPW